MNDKTNKLLTEVEKVTGDKPSKELKVKKSIRLLSDIVKSLDNKDNKDEERNELLLKALKDLGTINSKISESSKLTSEEVKSFDAVIKKLNNIGLAIGEVVKANDDTESLKELRKIAEGLEKLYGKEFPTKMEVTNFPKPEKQKEFPKEIKVSNLPTPEKFPKEITVSNLHTPEKFPESFKISNLHKPKEYPKSLKVSNFPKQFKIEKPNWYSPLDIDTFTTKLNVTLSEIILKVDASKHKDPKEALAVRLVDSKGKFIDSLIPKIQMPTTYGAPSGPKTVGLVAGTTILVAERSDGGDTDAAVVGDTDKLYTASFENVAGQQVHVVGDGDKYVVSNSEEENPVGASDAIPMAGEDTDGNKQNLQVNASKELKVDTDELEELLEDAQVTEGGQEKQVTVNFTQEELMEQMLIELKKISLQMALLTDTILKDEDIDN